MHRSYIAVVLALTTLGAGCATNGRARLASPPAAAGSSTTVQDERYIARVEQHARVRGIDLKWINPPRARHVATQSR